MGKPWKDSDKLEEEYWVEGKSQREIADEFGVSQRTISKWMNKLGVKRRDRSVDLDRRELKKLYIGEGLTQHEIAERAGCTQAYVSELMRKFGMNTMRRRYEKPASFWHHPEEGYELVGTKYKEERFYTPVHRLQAVAEWGVEAVKGKVVHHKNRIPWDNRIENFSLITPEEHNRRHRKGMEWNPEGEKYE